MTDTVSPPDASRSEASAAPLVTGPTIDATATRTSLEERLALVFDAAGAIGWWDWDVRNDRLYAGQQFADLFGVDPEKAAQGAQLASFIDGIDSRDRERVAAAIRATVESCGSFSEEYRIAGDRNGHRPRWVLANGRSYPDESGETVRFAGVLLDITARKLTELRKHALLELGDRLRDLPDMESIAYAAAEILAEVLLPSRAGFGIVERESERIFLFPEWRREGAHSIAGVHHFREYGSFIEDLRAGRVVSIDDVEHDPRTAEQAELLLSLGIKVLINIPIIEHDELVLVVFIHNDGPVDWNERDMFLIHAVADRVQVALARLQAERQRELLNRELSHRLKNSLSMVQSIVAQSMRTASDFKEAREAIGNRLSTLGRAHELLLSGTKEDADIAEVTASALLPHQPQDVRIHWQGPNIRLSASAALSLSLVLHELATNALKYGALSKREGIVDIRWRIEEKERQTFVLEWREKGGPPVEPPQTSGFGSRLIRHGLSGAVNQSVDIRYEPEGLYCRIEAGLDNICTEAG